LEEYHVPGEYILFILPLSMWTGGSDKKKISSPLFLSPSLIFAQVFDIPSRGTDPFESRLEYIQSLFGPGGSHCSDHVAVVKQEKVKDKQHVFDKLKEIESLGGEGIMLREPKS